jgi:penicillin-binding protein 1A
MRQKPAKTGSVLKTLLKWLFLLLLTSLASFAIAIYLFLAELSKELPDIDQLQNVQYQTPLSIYSQDGLLIAQFGEKRRIPITINQVPKRQVEAFLAAEDDRFYSHSGIDYKGLLRASAYLAATGKKRQGGSTITMQVVRNFLLSNEKTYLRKLKEILLALQIEQRYSKNAILELYLNKIYMGQRAYGVAAAAQTYYGKDMQDLTLAQQAMIAGLPKAPSQYNPITNPERALERRNYVLRRMQELQYITDQEYDQAVAQADDAKLQTVDIQLDAPYVAEMARQEMMSRYGDDAYSQGLKVYTTVPGKLQQAADHALQYALHVYDERHGYRDLPHKKYKPDQTQLKSAIGDCYQAVITSTSPQGIAAKLADNLTINIPWRNLTWSALEHSANSKHSPFQANDLIWVRQLADQTWGLTQIPAVEGAFAALNPNNGAILAISGGFDFSNSNYNRATQSKRQPGSGFKPFIYTAALEKGFSPASIVNDAPVVIEDPSQESGGWRPENYTHKFRGPIPLRVALRESINLVSVRLLQDIGIEYALGTAMRFGFEREQLPNTFSLALGSGQANPLRMAAAYATFANGGYLIKPYLIDHIEDHSGATVYRARPLTACGDCAGQPADTLAAPRIVSPPVTFLMNSLLRDVVQHGTATQAKELGRDDLAGKTGTTNEQRDAWFNGFQRDIVASAWVGFDNSAPLGKGETGGKAALPMWIEFMRVALQDKPVATLEPPPGIVEAYVNPRDGLLLKPESSGGVWEYFVEDSAPKSYSTPKRATPEFEDMLEDFNGNGATSDGSDPEALF